MCASSLNFLALRTFKIERVKRSYHELVSIKGGFKGLQRRPRIADRRRLPLPSGNVISQ